MGGGGVAVVRSQEQVSGQTEKMRVKQNQTKAKWWRNILRSMKVVPQGYFKNGGRAGTSSQTKKEIADKKN